MVQRNNPEANQKEFPKNLTPAISDSFDQLASQYEDIDVDLDDLVNINLPYCDNEVSNRYRYAFSK